MSWDKLVRYKHEDGKLIKTFYDEYKGVCPKCGDGDIKSPREVTKLLNGEMVQRFTCNACDFTGTGDKFDLPRTPVIPKRIEVVEGVGKCPRCGKENVSFPNGSHRHYSTSFRKLIIYKYLKCRDCGYRGRIEKFGVGI